jgi:hypothetical protein
MLGTKKVLIFLCAIGLALVMVSSASADSLVVDIDTSDPLSDVNSAYWSGSDYNHGNNLNNSGEATETAWLNALLGLPVPSITFTDKDEPFAEGTNSLTDYDPGFDWDYAIVKYAGWWDAYEDTGDDELLTAATATQQTISHVSFFGGEPNGNGNGPPVPEPATMILLGSGLIGLAGFGRKFKKRFETG